MAKKEKKGGKWIQGAIQHPGALKKALGVPEEKPIPKSKLTIKKSDTAQMKRRKNLAKTLGKFRKGKKK